jgi:hypothetical protein
MTKIHVSHFHHVDELDGPWVVTDASCYPDAAVALRFRYSLAMVNLLKSALGRPRCPRNHPAGRWSGQLAHPQRRRPGFGFFEEVQVWDHKDGGWRWPKRVPNMRKR